MPQKPRRRRKQGLNRGYIVGGIVLVALLGFAGWYLYGSNISSPVTSSLGSTSQSSTSTTTSSAAPIYATIQTSMGTIEAVLFPASAPKTVANFVSLAEAGFYNNLVWHRIEPGFVIQTGDPNTRYGAGNRSLWGQGTSGTTIPFEYDSSLHNYEYYLGMASTNAGAGGSSQFYINLANNTNLDGSYAVFGEVISGTNVVQALGSVPVELVGGQHEPITPVYVTSITISDVP